MRKTRVGVLALVLVPSLLAGAWGTLFESQAVVEPTWSAHPIQWIQKAVRLVRANTLGPIRIRWLQPANGFPLSFPLFERDAPGQTVQFAKSTAKKSSPHLPIDRIFAEALHQDEEMEEIEGQLLQRAAENREDLEELLTTAWKGLRVSKQTLQTAIDDILHNFAHPRSTRLTYSVVWSAMKGIKQKERLTIALIKYLRHESKGLLDLKNIARSLLQARLQNAQKLWKQAQNIPLSDIKHAKLIEKARKVAVSLLPEKETHKDATALLLEIDRGVPTLIEKPRPGDKNQRHSPQGWSDRGKDRLVDPWSFPLGFPSFGRSEHLPHPRSKSLIASAA